MITDLQMPPGYADEGIEATAEIRSHRSSIGLMMLSQYVEVHQALRLTEEFDGAVRSGVTCTCNPDAIRRATTSTAATTLGPSMRVLAK